MRRVTRDQLARVNVKLNGRTVSAEAEPRMLLSDFIRQALGATGTHVGCEHGVCGACTVLVDGSAVRSCLMLAVQAEGKAVQTIESLGSEQALHPLQRAFAKHHALQCGYCTPGMLLSFVEFLRDVPEPTAEEVREAISGNLCRCTGYQNIVNAVLDAATELRGGSEKQ